MTLSSFKTALIAGAVIALPAITAVPAMAQTTTYMNLGYSRIETDSLELGGVQGRFGVGFGPNFGVEAEATIGTEDDAGVELDNELGLFGVAKLPLSPQFDIFARAGMTRVETSPGGDDDAFAYGAGANWFFTDKDGIRADWTRHDFDDEVDQWSISYVRKF